MTRRKKSTTGDAVKAAVGGFIIGVLVAMLYGSIRVYTR